MLVLNHNISSISLYIYDLLAHLMFLDSGARIPVIENCSTYHTKVDYKNITHYSWG